MSLKSKYTIISAIMNAALGVLCFFGGFFSIITVSIDTNASGEIYKLIITAIIVVLACILIPLLFNRILYSFFKKKLDKKYLLRGYIYFVISFVISFAILMIYTFYQIANPVIETE